MLKEMTVEEFVREVASSSPAPGGGSVAALAGAQAAGLLSMYCSLSQNREKLGQVVDMLQQAGEEARFLMTRLLETIDEDTLAFNRVMEAYRLPAEGERGKTERKAAIRESARMAAEVPLQAARGSLRVLSLIGEVAGKGNPKAISDLGVANIQAHSGLIGACYNVAVNLEMIGDQDVVTAIERERVELIDKGTAFFDANLLLIENAIER